MIGAAAEIALETFNDPRSLSEKAYQMLVRKITRLELEPGAAISDKYIMEVLAIGRTPIREALQRLSTEGLVVHIPNRGMYVSEVDASNVQHIYEFRALIDGQAARLAALRSSAKDTRDLLTIQLHLAGAIDNDDLDGFVEHDRKFYATLANAAKNIYLGEVIPRIFNLHLRLWFVISDKIGGWHEIARAHADMVRDIVNAIERGDPEEAEMAVKFYVYRRHKEIREVLKIAVT